MNLEALIASFREDAADTSEPPLWKHDDVVRWFNEAEAEAAIRGRLLLDDFTPAVCNIAVAEGVANYQLHPKVYEIAHISLTQPAPRGHMPVDLVTREYLDRKYPDWRTRPDLTKCFVIQTDTRLRMVPVPKQAGTLTIEAYRLPLKAMVNDTDKPEIHEAHHAYLVHWALHRAYSKPDADGFDPTRAEKAETAFTEYFGPRPDSDLRRATRHDEPQTTVACDIY